MQNLITLLTQRTSLKSEYITNILKLLDDGSTIPFIARYRKELTGGASDEVLRDFETIYLGAKKLLERKEEIKNLIIQRATLTPAIEQSIDEAQTLTVLEDIYRPYKESKNTRASEAIKNGLQKLSDTIALAKMSQSELFPHAKKFINENIKTADEAITGAKDILAQNYADNPKEREVIRNTMLKHGSLEVKKAKEFDENGLYKNFVGKSEKVAYIPSHRYLAIMRGIKEKQISAKITIDLERIEQNIKNYKIPRYASDLKEILFSAYQDGLKRLLLPSIEREVHQELKLKADTNAINTFGKNLNQLLMTPPVTKRVILGVDPAFVSGCKLAVIDENSNYLDSAVIYPTKPKEDYANSKRKVLELVKKYNIKAIAIGNGTASRETEEFFAKLNDELTEKLSYTIVSEAGASVYSASKLASLEYPELDVTIRGAISIGARLRDPMATLVKIDPKSLGIGQYQHDVDQKMLEKKLEDVTTDLVNRVGVDINSASTSLLAFVAGVGVGLAKKIVAYREINGSFQTKEALLKIKGLGQKVYEQAAGFIRIPDAKNPLDNTGIHPESYKVASKLLNLHLDTLDIDTLVNEFKVGRETLKDIVFELKKPGFDPREELPAVPFKKGLTDISMLKEGSFVSGIVRNITDFGAFIDIGLKNDALLHISKMSAKKITHPLEVLSLNEYLPNLEVLSLEQGKVSLGLNSYIQ